MKHVTIVVPNCHVNLNSIGGAYEILSAADDLWQQQGNQSRLTMHVASFVSALELKERFLTIHPTDVRQVKTTNLVIIPSIFEDFLQAVENNTMLIDWIRLQYKRGAEIASMCSGTFLLAATGLVDGKSCSVHWNVAQTFRAVYPEVKIAEQRIITDENGIYTNGGGYSFLNLMLYIIEKYFDRATAVLCAKLFQIDIERTSQSPFAIFRAQKNHGDEIIGKAQVYMEENIDTRISFEKLAFDLAISRRNFDRRFIKATGNTPVEYLQRVKVEAAKKELEIGRKSISEIMNAVGYNDDKAFREVFKRITGLSPLDYKNKYNREVLAMR